ncbi:MAG TPA: hypothetical protein PK794_11670, partial [Armatimonadota bacterium]|nr:hypothetical protein [Armatimonadota bacterium]
MAVYQPNAVLGNAQMLVTLGEAGEIMACFYPHIDYPQNVQEGMPAVYLGPRGHGVLSWTYEDAWQKRQFYVARRNILVTELLHPGAGVALRITDLVHPRHHVFVRRFALRNVSTHPSEGVLMQYLYLRLGEAGRKNSARRLDDVQAVVQYWRNLCFAMGGDPFDAVQIGKAGGHSHNSAKTDMQDGYLSFQREELGDVDTAYAWNYWLQPGESLERTFLIVAATSEATALAQLAQHRAQGFDALYSATDHWWDAWLAAAAPV